MIWRVAKRSVDLTQQHKLATKSRGHPLECACLVQKSVANYLNNSYFHGEECVRNYLIHTKPLWKSRSSASIQIGSPTEAIPLLYCGDRIDSFILKGNQIAKLNHRVKEQKQSNFHTTAFRLFSIPMGSHTAHSIVRLYNTIVSSSSFHRLFLVYWKIEHVKVQHK